MLERMYFRTNILLLLTLTYVLKVTRVYKSIKTNRKIQITFKIRHLLCYYVKLLDFGLKSDQRITV